MGLTEKEVPLIIIRNKNIWLKYKQEYIFGIRAVMEAIQQGKEIDKVMLKQGTRGELFQSLFALNPGK